MATTTLDELSIKFTADINGLKTGLDKIEMAVLKMAATTDKASKKMAGSFNSFGRFLKFDVLARYGAQLIRLETQQEELAASIKDVADQANIGTESLQRLRAVSDNNSGSAQGLDQALVKLQRSMGQARSGAKDMREVFEALGLEDLLDKGASTEEMFYGVASAVSKLKDDSQAAAVVTKIMGKTADELVQTLQLGGPAAREMAAQIKGVISNETIQKLDAANDRTKEFNRKMNALGAAASTVFVDIVEGLSALDEQWGISTLAVEGYTKAVLGLRLAWALWGSSSAARPPALGKSGDDLLSGFNKNFKSKPAPDGITPDEGKIGSLFATGGGGRDKAADDAIRAAEQYKEAIDDLTFSIAQLSRTEAEAAYQEELRNRLSAAGVTLENDRGQAIEELVGQLTSAQQASEALAKSWEVDAFRVNQALEQLRQEAEEFAETWERIGEHIEGAFVDTFTDIVSGAADAEEAFKRLIAQVLELIAQQLILQAIQGATGGAGGIGAALAGIVGGFAAGGTLNPGNAYQVHKNETIIPQVPMSVIPAGKGGGGSNFTYSPTIYAPAADAAMIRTMLAHQKQDILSMMPKVIKENTARGRF